VKALAIAGVSLRRLFRDRTNIFFVIVSPLLFLFVLGLVFGAGQAPQLGVVDTGEGPLAQRLTEALGADDRIEVVRFDDVEALRTDVERGLVNGGLVIPEDYDARLRDGTPVTLEWLAREGEANAASLAIWVRSVVSGEAALLRAAQFGQAEGVGDLDQSLQAVEQIDRAGPGVTVAVTTTGEEIFPEGLNQFAPLAPSLLLLFVFLTSLTAALGVIEARRLGVVSRMLTTPTAVGTVVAGEALGRFGIALAQGLIVIVGSALLFGVDWGDPLGAAVVLLLFCGAGSGAAMLIGASFRTEGPAMGVSLALGLGLAAIGGAMVPLEVLSQTAQTVARLTPHAWGYEAFAALVRHGAGITDIAPQLGVLAGFAVVLFALGIWRLRQALTR